MRNRTITFLFFNQNICCGYSKGLSQWDDSFEHQKHMPKIMGKKMFTILCWTFLFILYVCVKTYFLINLECQYHMATVSNHDNSATFHVPIIIVPAIYIRGEFNNASARRALVDWYLSLFIMCKAGHQYNERPRALALLNLPLVHNCLCHIRYWKCHLLCCKYSSQTRQKSWLAG